MFPVSDEYKRAIRAGSRRMEWYGVLEISKGGNTRTIEFKSKDIVDGSSSIVRSCSGSTELEIGSVYASELNLSLFVDVDRYTLKDAVLRPYFRLWLDGSRFEDVPLGVYDVSEATRTRRVLQLKAYDRMLKFDRQFPTDTSGGDAYTWITGACEACGVPLATPEAEIRAMPNGGQTFYMCEENDVQTWRDVLHYISACLCAYCQIDREGGLVIQQYNMDRKAVIPLDWRYSSEISDFDTRYTAVSATFKENDIAEYYYVEPDDGLTYNLETNPFLQFSATAVRRPIVQAICDRLSLFRYIPFKSEIPGDPAFDPGDVVLLTGGQADGESFSCITDINLKIGGRMTIKGVGKNARLASAKSKNDKNLAGIMAEVKKDRSTFWIYHADNVSALHITSEMTVCILNFATVDDSRVVFELCSVHTLSADGNVVVRIYVDDELIQTYRDYEDRGTHTLTLNFSLECTGVARHKIQATMQYEAFLSDRRVDAADRQSLWNCTRAIISALEAGRKIAEGDVGGQTWEALHSGGVVAPGQIEYEVVEPDRSGGVIDIDRHAVFGVLFGRGLAATGTWDGTIEASDYAEVLNFVAEPLILTHMREELGLSLDAPIQFAPEDDILSVQIPEAAFTPERVFNRRKFVLDIRGESTIHLTGSSEGTADALLDTIPARVYAVCGPNTRVWVSADSGINWLTWDASRERWHVSEEGNTSAEMAAVTEEEWRLILVNGMIAFKWVGPLSEIQLQMHGPHTVLTASKDDAVFDVDHVKRGGGFRFITEYSYEGREVEIDRGHLAVIEIPTDGFSEVTAVEVTAR